MSLYAERAYFDGDQCQHVADRDEANRLDRKHRLARQMAEAWQEIARFSRLSNPLPKSQVPQFQRSLDALFTQAKLHRQLKEI